MYKFVYEFMAWAGKAAPLPWLDVAGRVLGTAMWYGLPGRRSLARANMIRALGTSFQTATMLGRQSFSHNGRSFAEIFTGRRADWRWFAEHVHVAQPEMVARMQASRRPVVATTGHFGAWELLAPVMGMLFPERSKQVVIRHGRDEAMFRLLQRLRHRTGIEVLGHRKAAPAVVRHLHRGGVTAFLTDHNTTQKDAAFLPFLGRMAAVNMGPALLALRAKALVWPVYLHRQGRGYIFDADPPLDTATLEGDREDRCRQVAELYTAAMERRIMTHPEQWFWMHNRWKTQPRGEQKE